MSNVLPRRPDLVIVLNDVLVGAVESHRERRARAAGGRFETRVGRDHVVGQNGAVAPSANAQPLRIGDAHLDDLIDAGFQILHFIVSPIGEDGARKLLPASRAAAIIHRQHRVSVGREPLLLGAERMRVLPVRSAMNAQQQRNLRARSISNRLSQQAVNLRAVLALEAHVFGGRNIEFARTVRRSDASTGAATPFSKA